MGLSNIEALMKCFYIDQLQEVETMLYSLYNLTDIDASSGIQLDKIGKIIGQPRLGLNDVQYRLFIRGKIAQSVSHGTMEDLYITYEAMTGDTDIEIFEAYPCYVEMIATDSIPGDNGNYVKNIMSNATVAGVRFGGIRNKAGTGYLRLDGEDFFESDLSTTTGWAVGTNWSIDTVNETADHAAGAAGSLSFGGVVHAIGTVYTAKVTCTVTGGDLTFWHGAAIGSTIIPNGTSGKVIFRYTADGVGGVQIDAALAAVAQITEIKVFEQGSNGWNSTGNPTIGGKWNYYIAK